MLFVLELFDLPSYCGESDRRFEALLKLVYKTLVESRGNIAS